MITGSFQTDSNPDTIYSSSLLFLTLDLYSRTHHGNEISTLGRAIMNCINRCTGASEAPVSPTTIEPHDIPADLGPRHHAILQTHPVPIVSDLTARSIAQILSPTRDTAPLSNAITEITSHIIVHKLSAGNNRISSNPPIDSIKHALEYAPGSQSVQSIEILAESSQLPVGRVYEVLSIGRVLNGLIYEELVYGLDDPPQPTVSNTTEGYLQRLGQWMTGRRNREEGNRDLERGSSINEEDRIWVGTVVQAVASEIRRV